LEMADDLLVFEYPGLAARANVFFEALREREGLARQFLASPAGVVSEWILALPEPLQDTEIDRANRFLFSLLSNPGFMRWAEDRQSRYEEQIRAVGKGEETKLEFSFDRDELFQELAGAILEHGGEEMAKELGVSDLSRADEEVLPNEVPKEMLLSESRFKVPLPKPVNFNVAVNATVGATVAGAVAVVVVAVFVVPVVVIGLLDSGRFDREDLRRVAVGLNEELLQHAEQLRDEGELGPGTPA